MDSMVRFLSGWTWPRPGMRLPQPAGLVQERRYLAGYSTEPRQAFDDGAFILAQHVDVLGLRMILVGDEPGPGCDVIRDRLRHAPDVDLRARVICALRDRVASPRFGATSPAWPLSYDRSCANQYGIKGGRERPVFRTILPVPGPGSCIGLPFSIR